MLPRVGMEESTGMKPAVNSALSGVQVSPVRDLMLSESSKTSCKNKSSGSDFISVSLNKHGGNGEPCKCPYSNL